MSLSFSHLKVPPLSELLEVAVCDDDGVVLALRQALIILHQLIGFVYSEQLQENNSGGFTGAQARRSSQLHLDVKSETH